MRNLHKKLWSKVVLGILILGFIVSPIQVNLQQGFDLQMQKAEAEITGLTISAPSSITKDLVIVDVTVLGQKASGEEIILLLKTEWANVNEFNLTTLTVTNGVIKNVNIPGPFDPDTKYFLVATVTGGQNVVTSNTVSFQGNGSNTDTNGGPAGTVPGQPIKKTAENDEFGCNAWPGTWFKNCPVLFLYYIIFKPLAALTSFAATFLDFFVYYSISREAYESSFVEKAWSVVRDISNMFFIIALLYVGIKTILGMHTSDNKRILSMIIMIALLLNFSLFVSKVVIDASNILARVFYSNITPYDKNGNEINAAAGTPKSVSVGLVRVFDPQAVISDPKNNLGEFTIVTIIFIILMIYMIIMFISMSMLFLGRVAALWIAMIFSPLAFVSLAVPFHMPGFGWKKWQEELFKSAFMAPIFAFFLYIIILFGGFLGEIQYDVASTSDSLTGWLDALMKNIIPFILIFVLLKEAQSLTKKYAGEMGEAFSKAGAIVGGVAVGAVAGGAAMIGRRTVGRAGAWMSRQSFAKESWGGRLVGGIGKRLGTASYDARNAKIAGYGLSSTGLSAGLNKVGKLVPAQTGGYEKFREDLKTKRVRRAEELSKVGSGERESRSLRSAEISLANITEKFAADMSKIEGDIKNAKEESTNATNALRTTEKSDPEYARIQREAKDASQKVLKLIQKQKDMKNAEGNYTNMKIDGKSIADNEAEVKKYKTAIHHKEHHRKLAYAKRLERVFWSDGHKEAAHKIRTGAHDSHGPGGH
ncbi:MAG: hypothetical protein ACK4FA_02115 [Candidatus Paceibacteria bacterium]